jgi:hypothetical protein
LHAHFFVLQLELWLQEQHWPFKESVGCCSVSCVLSAAWFLANESTSLKGFLLAPSPSLLLPLNFLFTNGLCAASWAPLVPARILRAARILCTSNQSSSDSPSESSKSESHSWSLSRWWVHRDPCKKYRHPKLHLSFCSRLSFFRFILQGAHETKVTRFVLLSKTRSKTAETNTCLPKWIRVSISPRIRVPRWILSRWLSPLRETRHLLHIVLYSSFTNLQN